MPKQLLSIEEAMVIFTKFGASYTEFCENKVNNQNVPKYLKRTEFTADEITKILADAYLALQGEILAASGGDYSDEVFEEIKQNKRN